jgi:tRNA(Leu) C34 or U34 (ribose-2'-O)-methylase TrmL
MTDKTIYRESAKAVNRGYAAVALFNPKNRDNVGSALRAVGCYDAAMLVVQGKRYVRSVLDVNDQWKHTPLIMTENVMDNIPHGCVPVAIEFVDTAKSLVDYVHPERAYYIFGPEDGSIPKEVMKLCRDVVYVPTSLCMNLAATVNVVLYDRLSKMKKK